MLTQHARITGKCSIETLNCVGSQYDSILLAFQFPLLWNAPLSRFCGLCPPSRPKRYSRTKNTLALRFHHHRDLFLNSFRLLSFPVGYRCPDCLVPRHRKTGTPETRINQLTEEDIILSSSPIQGLPHALALVSAAEPDKIYPSWPVSIMIALGGSDLLLSPLVTPTPAIGSCLHVKADINLLRRFRSAHWITR
ncbi:hypothetical protein EDB87DRAFT_1657633 [Lactarius vividus]|nr:hypothetical protein EDB87DRAFT_1657633 [Lactarius vividus]